MTEIMEVVTALTALTAVTAGDKLPASPLPSSAAGKCLLRLLFCSLSSLSHFKDKG